MLSKSSVYAGLRHYKRSFDNKLITVTQVRLFLRISGLQVEEGFLSGLCDCDKSILETPLAVGSNSWLRAFFAFLSIGF